MGKNLTGALAALLVVACTTQSEPQMPQSMAEIDAMATQLKEAILSSERPIGGITGTTYYISNQGCDSVSGLTPQEPLQTLAAVNQLELKPGDGVLFRRGDLWRGQLLTRAGVTYSAYGQGQKPRLYGSPCDAAKEGTWTETDMPHVWAYSLPLTADVGTLVFNHGQDSCAFKVMMVRHPDGSTTHIETGEPFASYKDLKRDLDFYHDYHGTGLIYLRSDAGNPAERYQSIEMNVKMNLVQARGGVRVDNLCLKYCGAHAVGAGTLSTLSVSQCEIGWVGGSIQGDALFGRNMPTRYGNGVEIYGGCQSYTVDSCYVYQIYDAAITHQNQGSGPDTIRIENVSYTHNLIEDCVYSFEYFVGRYSAELPHLMRGIRIADNICRRAGMGWGTQRPDKETPAQVKSWGHSNRAQDFVITRNVFDRSSQVLLNIQADSAAWLPRLSQNVYVQQAQAGGGQMGYNHKAPETEQHDMFWNDAMKNGMRHPFDCQFPQALNHLFGEDDPIIITIQ